MHQITKHSEGHELQGREYNRGLRRIDMANESWAMRPQTSHAYLIKKNMQYNHLRTQSMVQ